MDTHREEDETALQAAGRGGGENDGEEEEEDDEAVCLICGNVLLPYSSEHQTAAPSQWVHFILGVGHDDPGHDLKPIFSEMQELIHAKDKDPVWRETARWVKYEETVEEGGNRWSKPHVTAVSLHSLMEFRSMINNGTVCLDLHANNFEDLMEMTTDQMVDNGDITVLEKSQLVNTLELTHLHQHEKRERRASGENSSRLNIIRNMSDMGRNISSAASMSNMRKNKSDAEIKGDWKMNLNFIKKTPKDAEAYSILIGTLEGLTKPVSAFIRLADSLMITSLTEVPLKTRFIFFMLGPPGKANANQPMYREVGRAAAAAMTDDVFHEVAFRANTRDHLLAGIDEFLDQGTVLPPGEWDPRIRIEPPPQAPKQDARKFSIMQEAEIDEEEEEHRRRKESGLVRTGRLFGGLIDDIKRKKPHYISDFTDGFSMQCVASYFFIYFACMAPIITFGGLLGDATENRIAAMESLVSGLVVGVIYGLFSGQPLTIMGSTGPILVFETIVYDFCKTNDWDFLSIRLCIGVWIGVFLFILVAVDFSAYVSYITRFTEENFATLIALIFVKKAFEKVLHIMDEFPIHPSPCYCLPNNDTYMEDFSNVTEFDRFVEWDNETSSKDHHGAMQCQFSGGDTTIIGLESIGCHYVPNAFLMSVLLTIGTYIISVQLKGMRTALFFPTIVRRTLSDFAVVIAILAMTSTDYLMSINTPKLIVPDTFRPTWSGRGWLIDPIGNNPWWSPMAAAFPAMLATILIFMDQQITAVICNRKEFKLNKGCGYHLDLLCVAFLIIINSILGIPWFVAATVLALNHVNSLKMETETAAPGDKPQFLGIREQRVTTILIFITVGMSVFLSPVLALIPMPVLYGVFLYMGTSALDGLQLYHRILLFFMPKKYQPDVTYLRKIPLYRVHLFTIIQLLCFVALWAIKEIKAASIMFPIMLVVMIAVRKLLDYVFTKHELQILDDILPEFRRKEKMERQEIEREGTEKPKDGYQFDPSARRMSLKLNKCPCSHNNRKSSRAANADFNISKEITNTGVWKSLGPNDKEKSIIRKRVTVVDNNDYDDETEELQVQVDKSKKENGTPQEMQTLMKH